MEKTVPTTVASQYGDEIVARLQAKVHELSSKIAQLQQGSADQTVAKLQQQLASRNTEVAEARAHAAAADERLQAGAAAVKRLREHRREEVEQTDAEIEALKHKASSLDTKVLAAEEKAESAARRVQSLEAQLAATEVDIEEKESEVAVAIARAEDAESKLAAVGDADKSSKAEDAQSELLQARQTVTKLETANQRLKDELASLSVAPDGDALAAKDAEIAKLRDEAAATLASSSPVTSLEAEESSALLAAKDAEMQKALAEKDDELAAATEKEDAERTRGTPATSLALTQDSTTRLNLVRVLPAEQLELELTRLKEQHGAELAAAHGDGLRPPPPPAARS